MMKNLLNVWTKDFYFGYLGYFYNAGLLMLWLKHPSINSDFKDTDNRILTGVCLSR